MWNYKKLAGSKWMVIKACKKKCYKRFDLVGNSAENFADSCVDGDVYWAYYGFGKNEMVSGTGDFYSV